MNGLALLMLLDSCPSPNNWILHKALAGYRADPSGFVQSVPELTTQERTALELGDSWALRCAKRFRCWKLRHCRCPGGWCVMALLCKALSNLSEKNLGIGYDQNYNL